MRYFPHPLRDDHLSGINSRIVFWRDSRLPVSKSQTSIMAHISAFVVCLCALTAGSLAAPKIPSKWTTCHQSAPDYLECLNSAVEGAVKSMKSGERSLGIGPLDPLRVQNLHIGQGSGPVAVELDFNDLDFKGISSVKVEKARFDDVANTLDADAIITDDLVLDGKYKVQGKVLVLPIHGEGDCHLVLENVKAKVKLNGKIREEGGKRYMDIEKFDFQFEPSKMKMRFDNLFDGNKELGDNMNKFLNENYQVVLSELKPAISEAFGLAFKEISNRVFSKVPIDEIFPK